MSDLNWLNLIMPLMKSNLGYIIALIVYTIIIDNPEIRHDLHNII